MNSGMPGVAITNFDNEMIGLYRSAAENFEDMAASGVGMASKNSLGFGCAFLDVNLDGWLDLRRSQWPHRRNRTQHSRQCGLCAAAAAVSERRQGKFSRRRGGGRRQLRPAESGPRTAYADFDRDGDLDLLLTTNNGPAYLYRNDQLAGNRSIRFRLVGTKSNRDAIGAMVRVYAGGLTQSRMVKGGSSYLSQSELPVTFGLEKRDHIERVVIDWPSGRTEEYKNLAAGRCYECTEGKGIVPQNGY